MHYIVMIISLCALMLSLPMKFYYWSVSSIVNLILAIFAVGLLYGLLVAPWIVGWALATGQRGIPFVDALRQGSFEPILEVFRNTDWAS